MRLSSRLLSLFAAPLLLAGAAGAYASNHSQATMPAMVKTAAAHILVDAKGMTLYVFSPDSKNKSTCTGECAKFWPPVVIPSGATAPKSMTGIVGTFGVAMRADGSHQLTFDGAPLYTFLKDKKAGDLYGQGVAGTWWAVAVTGAS